MIGLTEDSLQDGKGPGHWVFVRHVFEARREDADISSFQELVLSSIYVYQASRLLTTSFNPKSRSILYQLLAVNSVVILLDLSLLVLQLINLHELQVSLKPAIYSIKLKLEFAVLGQLICLVDGGGSDRSRKSSTFISGGPESGNDRTSSAAVSDFVDLEKAAAALRRPSGTTTAHVSMSDTDLIMPRVNNGCQGQDTAKGAG